MNDLKDIAYVANRASRTDDPAKLLKLLKTLELMVKSAIIVAKIRLKEK
jgi:hypothetical protein